MLKQRPIFGPATLLTGPRIVHTAKLIPVLLPHEPELPTYANRNDQSHIVGSLCTPLVARYPLSQSPILSGIVLANKGPLSIRRVGQICCEQCCLISRRVKFMRVVATFSYSAHILRLFSQALIIIGGKTDVVQSKLLGYGMPSQVSFTYQNSTDSICWRSFVPLVHDLVRSFRLHSVISYSKPQIPGPCSR